jgi:hypothetical protein
MWNRCNWPLNWTHAGARVIAILALSLVPLASLSQVPDSASETSVVAHAPDAPEVSPSPTRQRPVWMSFLVKTYLDGLQTKPSYSEAIAAQEWLARGCDTQRVRQWLDSLLHTPRWMQAVLFRSWQERLTHTGNERLRNCENALSQDLKFQKDPLARLKLQQALEHTRATIQAPDRFKKGEIDFLEFQRIISLNPVYDDIYMGAQGFVYSFFIYFLERLPTKMEEEQASLMFEGFPTIFWGQMGQNKEDVVRIFFNHPAAAEGVVRKVYTQILGRRPQPERLAQLTAAYVESKDLRKVYRDCLQELYQQMLCN